MQVIARFAGQCQRPASRAWLTLVLDQVREGSPIRIREQGGWRRDDRCCLVAKGDPAGIPFCCAAPRSAPRSVLPKTCLTMRCATFATGLFEIQPNVLVRGPLDRLQDGFATWSRQQRQSRGALDMCLRAASASAPTWPPNVCAVAAKSMGVTSIPRRRGDLRNYWQEAGDFLLCAIDAAASGVGDGKVTILAVSPGEAAHLLCRRPCSGGGGLSRRGVRVLGRNVPTASYT